MEKESMIHYNLFHATFVILLVVMICIRFYYYRITFIKMTQAKPEDRLTFKEAWLTITLCSLLGLACLDVLVLYLLSPTWLAWSVLSLPTWACWSGAVLGGLALLLLLWTHHILRENFSLILHVRRQRTLVMRGPYLWVRHPRYTAIYMLLGAFFLLSANWLIGLSFLGGFTLLMLSRVPREEQMMIELLGDRYRAYMSWTGRFVPRLIF
jgi:protein-S-isoprenylcysteine O-methyltransferase Ste14